MSTEQKPRRVKAKITRTVTEIATVVLDSSGNVDWIDEVLEELGSEDIEVKSIQTVFSYHN